MRRLNDLAAIAVVVFMFVPRAAHAGGFVPREGSVWGKIAIAYWQAGERFAGIFDRDLNRGVELGDPIPFDQSTGGEFTNTSISASLEWVPFERWLVGGYFPFYQESTFTDSAFSTTTVGTGDIFLYSGYQVTSPGPVATTVYAHLKIPTTPLPVEFDNVPLSEGQYDVAIEQATSWALMPRLHLTLNTLLRKRFEFVDGDRILKPGDEFELGFEVGGGPWRWLWVKAAYRGLWSTGREDRSNQGSITLSERRQVHNVSVGAYLQFGQWIHVSVDGLALDLTATYPIAGQDYPRGPSANVGLAFQL